MQAGVQLWRCEREELCRCGMPMCVQAWRCGNEEMCRCRNMGIRNGADVEMWKCASVEVWGCAGVQVCTCEVWGCARVECGRLFEIRRVCRCGGVKVCEVCCWRLRIKEPTLSPNPDSYPPHTVTRAERHPSTRVARTRLSSNLGG